MRRAPVSLSECGTPSPRPSSRWAKRRSHPAQSNRGTAIINPPSRAITLASRRAAKLRAEMFQPRHHFLLQQRQRMMPGFGLVLVVEAEHQKHPEPADLAIDGLDLLAHGCGPPENPVVAGATNLRPAPSMPPPTTPPTTPLSPKFHAHH